MAWLFTAAALLLPPRVAEAQLPGSPITTFDPSVRVDGTAVVIAPQPDGKLVIGGDFSRIGTVAAPSLARLNADGSVDTGFTPPAAPGQLVYATVGADGKVAAVYDEEDNSPQTYTLLLLNADGSQDASFTPPAFHGQSNSGELYAFILAIQADGKVLVGGAFVPDLTSGITTNTVVRYNADGSPDTGFQVPSTLFAGEIDSVLPLANGQALVSGSFTDRSISYDTFFNVIRLNADGSRDASYPAGSTEVGAGYDLTLLPDGTVLYLRSSNSSYGYLGGLPQRLNADGTVDTSFAPQFSPGAAFDSLLVQPDGKVVVGGYTYITGSSYATTAQSGVVRLNADGTTDTTFNPANPLINNPVNPLLNNQINALGLQANGQIIVGGAFPTFDGLLRSGLGRLNLDGSADAAFVNDLTNTGIAYSVAVQTGGQTLVAVSGPLVDGTLASNLVSLNADGSLNTIFAADLSPAQYYYFDGAGEASFDPIIAVQTDGRVLLAASYDSTDIYGYSLERFNADGSLDSSFQPTPSGRYTVLRSVVPQTDGHIYVAGVFVYGSNLFTYPLNRLNADGSIDSTFTPATDPGASVYATSTIYALAVQPDGKVIAAGAFLNVDGQAQPDVLRFNTDGSVDTSFNAGVFTTSVADSSAYPTTLALQSDGKVIAGGFFSAIGGVPDNNLARLNADGSVDTSFNTGGAGPVGGVSSVIVQPDGKIILGGSFTTVNGVALSGVARLLADGTVDPQFDPGTGTAGTGVVNSVALAPDGSIAVGGTFTAFDGQARDGVARLVGGDVTAPVITSAATATAQVGQAFAYTITASNQPTSYSATGLPDGLVVANTGVISGVPATAGTFTVTLSATNLGGATTGPLILTVNPPTPVLGNSSVSAQADVAFSFQVSATNSPTSYTAAPLPAGLTIDPTTGLISGTPTAAGTFAVAVSATNAGGTGTGVLTLTVIPNPPTVTVVDAGDGEAVEGSEVGKVLVQRTGDTSAALTVLYKVQGSAKSGVAYKPVTGSATIPAGASKVKIKIKPLADPAADGILVAKIKLKPSADGSYILGSPAVAKIKVIDND